MKTNYSKVPEMFTKQLMSCNQIAKTMKVSRQTIWKFLRSHGIDTSKGKTFVICNQCGISFKKTRCRIRNNIHNFCSRSCYFEYIKNPNYNPHRQGQRIARQVFEKEICFTHDWFIHHNDGNNKNNEINNLWAFKTQTDHMRYHRGGKSIALIGKTREWQEVEK
jgi:hypothetical protein